MKRTNLLLLLFVTFTLNTIAQEIQLLDSTKWLCQYHYKLQEDSTNRNSAINSTMILQIGSHLSKFCQANSFTGDSLLYYNQGVGIDSYIQLLSKAMYRANPGSLMAQYIIYKNYPTLGSMLFTAYGDHVFYKLEQPMKIIWDLDNLQDSIILGFNCQKAYTTYGGRNYTAWYAPQIPVSDGPYKFNGLPGLILKIYDAKNEHCFNLTSLKQVKYFQPIFISKLVYVDITPKEYNKMMKNKLISWFGTIQGGGTVTFDNEEDKARAMKGLKIKNNFIEKF
ncbi:MAG: GLPGLI family protein [Marinilabiliales bacterium]|nr:GLPGLI family protein [Marinilabiliales bacterium]